MRLHSKELHLPNFFFLLFFFENINGKDEVFVESRKHSSRSNRSFINALSWFAPQIRGVQVFGGYWENIWDCGKQPAWAENKIKKKR